VVIPYQHFGTTYQLTCATPQLIGCPKTSVGNCHCSLCNNPGESNCYTDLAETSKLKNPQKHFHILFHVTDFFSVFLFLLLSETWSSVVLNFDVTRQAMYIYIVTLRCICATTVAVEKQSVLYILSVYSLRYPACNAHAPYCHLWPTWLYNIFPHYLISGMIF